MPTAPSSAEPSVESTPSVTPATTNAPATSPSDAFSDDVPGWIQATGLTAAHKAAVRPGEQKPATPVTPAVTPTVTPAAPVTPTAAPAFTPPPTTFDQAGLAKAIADGLRQGQPAAPVVQRSDAELAKELGIYTADDAAYEAILGVKPSSPAQVAALNNALQGVAKQAVTIANLLIKQSIGQVESRFAPYQKIIQEREAQNQRDIFYTENADLKGFSKLVETNFRNMLNSGQTFPTVEAARKAVAEETKKMLQDSGIQLPAAAVTPATTSTPRTTATPARTMSPASTGGRNGGGGPVKATTTMDAVWGKQ